VSVGAPAVSPKVLLLILCCTTFNRCSIHSTAGPVIIPSEDAKVVSLPDTSDQTDSLLYAYSTALRAIYERSPESRKSDFEKRSDSGSVGGNNIVWNSVLSRPGRPERASGRTGRPF